MAQRYDAVIIGGGHNGLVSAAYLARAGMRTLVLEKRHVLGGAAVTEEIFPGFRFSVASYVVSLLRPEIIRELDLPRHGLDILPLDGTFTPLDGDYLWRVNDHGRTIRELRRWNPVDAEAYEEYGQLMVEMARFIKPILSIVPPDPTGLDPRQFAPLAGLARSFQRLPELQRQVFVQLMTMSATDFLRQWFTIDPLIATMSASGIIGTFQGVQSPGTAYVLLHHYMGEIDGAFRAWGIPKGGTGGISNAIGSAARALGAEIRTEAPVARIDVRNGRAVGVVLESGEEIGADVVLSSVDARLTYLALVESGTLEPAFEDEVRHFKFRGSSGK
ncbi:MAG TPA: NAD(P)/FAD-dependent oxidoreductase, partial [Candidatus Binatia bacterium]|nr:NAD(P)/FAD-dependent oxidoreductase [Candidatus Binatia bacterium]